jgi:tRNA-dependent cyclodipeptide synthase
VTDLQEEGDELGHQRTLTGIRVLRQSRWHLRPIEARTASFEISIGNPLCRGEALAVQLDWAAPRFRRFEFSVGDTLNVYNFITIGHPRRGRLDPVVGRSVAEQEGDAWVDTETPLIGSVLPLGSWTIHRWDWWMSRPIVRKHLRTLLNLLDVDRDFRKLVDDELMAYLRRRGKGGEAMEQADAVYLHRYVLEELAVYQYQVEKSSAVHLYPGNDLLLRRLPTIAALPDALKSVEFVLLHLSGVRPAPQ